MHIHIHNLLWHILNALSVKCTTSYLSSEPLVGLLILVMGYEGIRYIEFSSKYSMYWVGSDFVLASYSNVSLMHLLTNSEDNSELSANFYGTPPTALHFKVNGMEHIYI